jgi:hypothetical protein
MISNNEDIFASSLKNKFIGKDEKKRMLIPVFQDHNN